MVCYIVDKPLQSTNTTKFTKTNKNNNRTQSMHTTKHNNRLFSTGIIRQVIYERMFASMS